MFDPVSINKIGSGEIISELSKAKLINLQQCLSWMAYPISKIDGRYGPNTRNAFAEFKHDIGEDEP